MAWLMRVDFGINLIYKKNFLLILLIDCMFCVNPTTKKIIPAWSFNHSLEIIVSSLKNSTNSRDIPTAEIIVSHSVSMQHVEIESEVIAITREGLSFTGNHVILPTTSN